jgi:hypothetical protein
MVADAQTHLRGGVAPAGRLLKTAQGQLAIVGAVAAGHEKSFAGLKKAFRRRVGCGHASSPGLEVRRRKAKRGFEPKNSSLIRLQKGVFTLAGKNNPLILGCVFLQFSALHGFLHVDQIWFRRFCVLTDAPATQP